MLTDTIEEASNESSSGPHTDSSDDEIEELPQHNDRRSLSIHQSTINVSSFLNPQRISQSTRRMS